MNSSPFYETKNIFVDIEEAYIFVFDKDIKDILIAQAFLFLCPITGVFQLSLNEEQFLKIEKVFFMMMEETNPEILLLHSLLVIKYIESFRNDSNSERMVEHPIVKEFVKAIDKEYAFSHNINYYANKLIVTTRTLNRIFKDTTGITPKQSLNYRLNLEAKKILMKNNKSIKEISYNLGFKSPEYFNMFFKNINGVSPVEYVKEMSYNISFLSQNIS